MTQIKFPLEGINRKYDAIEKQTTASENTTIKTILNETRTEKRLKKMNKASVSRGQY